MPAGPRTVKVDSRSGAITDHRVPRPHALNLLSEWSARPQSGGLYTSRVCAFCKADRDGRAATSCNVHALGQQVTQAKKNKPKPCRK